MEVVPLLLLLLSLLGCPTPEADTPDDTSLSSDTLAGPGGPSRVEPSCAPDDGLAVVLVVGAEEDTCDSPYVGVPHLRISLWSGGVAWPLEPGTYSFDEGAGSAWYLGEGGSAEEHARSGTLTVEAASDGAVRGTYRVELDGGGIVAGAFEAAVCEVETRCG